MKKLLFIALAILVSGIAFAQKNVNVDNYRFNYKTRNNPQKALNPMFFYYASTINLSSTLKGIVEEESLYNNLRIDGQRITDNPSAEDLIISVNMGGINITGVDVNTRTVENKDKDGKITSRDYYYSVIVKYTFEASAMLTKGENEIDKYTMYGRSNTLTYQSSEYNTSKAASEYWNNNKEVLKEQFARDCANSAISTLSNALSKNFGFPVIKDSDIIKTINEKKHPENDPLRAMSDALKTKLESLDGTNPLKEEDLTDIIDYFKNIPVKYTDEKLKADVRLRYVAYYNLCKIYLYLDQPDKVEPWAALILENGHDKKDCERMQKEAGKLRLQFSKSEIKSRQFNPDSYFQD